MDEVFDTTDTGILGFTYNDAFSIVLRVMESPVLSALINEPKQFSIYKPTEAARNSYCDFKDYLYDQNNDL